MICNIINQYKNTLLINLMHLNESILTVGLVYVRTYVFQSKS